MNSKQNASKNRRTKRLTFTAQRIQLLVMKRTLLIIAIVTCFIATSFAQSSRKKPQYKSTTNQTKVITENRSQKNDERNKVKETSKKESRPRVEEKREVRRRDSESIERKSKPKETDRFVDKDNNGTNDLTERRKEKKLPESFLNVIEKLLKKIRKDD